MTSRQLAISPDLSLPLDAQTHTLVVYGGKGMGKTNLGSVFVEELAKHSLRFSVIDPLDVWWGLQHGATRTGQGIDVVILGGPHGDIPIEPTAGAVVADFVADEEVSTVIVLRGADGTMWSNGERIRFVAAYATQLFKRQGERRRPLLQVIDEAGRFVPQMAQRGDEDIAKCVGAIEQLVEWGRNIGVGVCLITQRSARMAKNVSELADTMVAFRTVGPNSIAAIVDWFGEHVPKERHRELVEQLRKLDRGTALVVSPGYLGFEGTARIRARETFDSSSTPEGGKDLRAPGKARKPDLEQYRARMATTIEQAQAKDPRALRARLEAARRDIEKLHSQLEAEKVRTSAAPAARGKEKVLDIKLVDDIRKALAGTDEARGFALDMFGRDHAKAVAALEARLEAIRSYLFTLAERVKERIPKPAPADAGASTVGSGRAPAAAAPAVATHHSPRREPLETWDDDVVDAEWPADKNARDRILRALAQSGEMDRRKLAILTGVKSSGSTMRNALGALRAEGLVERNEFALTEKGRAAMKGAAPLPTGKALRLYWQRKLGNGAAGRIFDNLTTTWPNAWSTGDLAAACGPLVVGGSTMRNALGKLRGLDLVEPRRLKAADELFDAGERPYAPHAHTSSVSRTP